MVNAETYRGGRPRWRKRLTRGVLCLVLGAVTTVSVAWGLSGVGSFNMSVAVAYGSSQSVLVSRYIGPVSEMASIRVSLGDEFDAVMTTVDGDFSSQLAAESAAALPVDDVRDVPLVAAIPAWAVRPPMPRADPAPGTTEASSATTMRQGWPWAAFTKCHHHEYRRIGMKKQTISSRMVGSVEIAGANFSAMPISAGLALNTLFYAVPWWLLLVAPGAVKRWRRGRRGRCIGCGYDLAGLAVGNGTRTCPECGGVDRVRREAPAKT